MARKRNVDAESHLLTGGLVTGFLTFMGFLPGAAASAAVTGSLVHNDIQKAKKQEAFQRDFAVHQARTERGRAEAQMEVWRIKEMLDSLTFNFDPNSQKVINQERLEKAFWDASTRDSVYRLYRNEGRNEISIAEMIEMASKVDAKSKIVEIDPFSHAPSEFIIKTEEEYYVFLEEWQRIPYKLRKQCDDLGIEFRKYDDSEIKNIMTKISMELNKPYQFDYSKYR